MVSHKEGDVRIMLLPVHVKLYANSARAQCIGVHKIERYNGTQHTFTAATHSTRGRDRGS